jgi:hypothetical protein
VSAQASGAASDTCGTASDDSGTIQAPDGSGGTITVATWCINDAGTYLRIKNVTKESQFYVLSVQDASDGATFHQPTGPEFTFDSADGVTSDEVEQVDQDVWLHFKQHGPGAGTVASNQTLVVTSTQAMANLTVKYDASGSIAHAASEELAKQIAKYINLFPPVARAKAMAGCIDGIRGSFDGAKSALSTPAMLTSELQQVYKTIPQCKNVYDYLVKDTNDPQKTGEDKPKEDASIFGEIGDAAKGWIKGFGKDLLKIETERPVEP